MANEIVVLFAKRSGNQRVSALSINVAERHQQRKDRHAQRNAGHQISVVCPADKKRVRQIVNQRNKHAQNNRK